MITAQMLCDSSLLFNLCAKGSLVIQFAGIKHQVA